MLRFFSRLKNLQKIIFLLFCAVLVLGLIVAYGIPGVNLNTGRGLTANPDDDVMVAKVGSRNITLREFRQQIDALSQMYVSGGNALPPAIAKSMGLDKQALDRLIEDRLALAEADRLNITATNQEVSDQIKSIPGFLKEDGSFIGLEEYRRTLALRGENVEKFEDDIRRQILLGKMHDLLGAPAQVSDKEVEEKFVEDNTTVDVVYAQIDQSKVKDTLKFTEDELKSYYDGHKDEFKTTDKLFKAEYVFIPTDKATGTVPITEEKLKAEYEERKQFEPRVSIIRLNILTPADEATVKAKVDELNRRVRGNPGPPEVKPEDFATVARGNSQDPSAAKGGDIGFIKKDPNRATDWKQRAHGLKVGEIDGPFREGSSWLLMKVTEQRQIPFNEMRPTLVASLKNRDGYVRASQIADKVYEEFTLNKDIRKAAEAAAKELNIASPETLIRHVPFFKKGDTLPELGSNPQFENAITALSKGGIGDKIGVPNGLAVPRLLETKEAGEQLAYEDARFQVEQKLRSIKEPDAVKAMAQRLIAQAKTAAELEAQLKKEGLEAKKDSNFNTFSFGSLQTIQQLRTAALALKNGEVAQTPVKVGASWLVFAATGRKDPDLSRLGTERASYRQRLLDEVQSRAFDTHIKAARTRYEKEGKLTIYQNAIDKYFADAAAQPAGGQ